ncbi:exocyst complex component 3-like protein 4 [Scomber japonicus]|uniref:exocyst complex component 3-like protein 4 n=1 Tax=Scomber japonicus TaxID=13676 RepID=UPI002305B9B8|nr:exocyst complex component 3-like protein 4 [Scomber japonicus]
MSQMMDRSTETPDEDRVSISSNESTPANMKKLGVMQSFRNSVRRAVKSPLSPGAKGSKVTAEAKSAGNQQTPSSPSLSAGTPTASPLKNMGHDDTPARKSSSLPRSMTDPNMLKFFRGDKNYSSLPFFPKKKKEKSKNSHQEELAAVAEGLLEENEKEEEEKDEEEEEEAGEEIEETYALPELPHTPLSVMQINKLIENEVLEEAHLNLLALRQEFQQEQERCGEDSMELAKKEKDLSLLYGEMRNKINSLVRDSNSLPNRNKELLVYVARIIQEEEKRAKDPGGLPGSWMEAWREAVLEGVQAKLQSVHLEQKEKNTSWLAVHLGLLGKAIVEDLENVRRHLRWSYPPSFRVFSAYVDSYHEAVGQHLKKVEQQVMELKDQYALLDWIINRYKSEKIMGSVSLQPDMKDESSDLQLEENFLKRLKDKYCCRVKADVRSTLDRIIQFENEDVWSEKRSPDKEDDFLDSPFHMDIWTKVKSFANNSRKIDADLEQKAVCSCLEELKDFPGRFEAEFRRHCSPLKPQPLWTEYQITYINSFTSLLEHMEGYRDSCPDQVEKFGREVNGLINWLIGGLQDHYKEDVKPYLRRMMTRKWLTVDEDFEQLYRRTELLSQHCALMRPPHVQKFARELHYYAVKEYIGQLMKNNYSCKNRKHEKAAGKIRHQWDKLVELFENMKSEHDWLHYVGDELSDIIGQKNKTDIKDHLQPLVEHYPDFSKKHLVAVLNFRGLLRGSEHRLILQRLAQLKKKNPDVAAGDKKQVLFNDMQVTVNTDCLSNLPFSCFNFLLPDN